MKSNQKNSRCQLRANSLLFDHDQTSSMADERRARVSSRQSGVLPEDLTAVLLLTGLVIVTVFVPVVRETPLRVAFSLPFVLFVPGYAVIAALFPEDPASDERQETQWSSITHIERVLLSVGTSITVVPLIGVLATFTPWGITLAPVVIGTSMFTVVCTAIAAYRRRALPPDQRFSVPYRTWIGTGRERLFEPSTKVDLALNVMIVMTILLVAVSVGYAVTGPQQGDQFTEFYILTENETGELVADGYPTEFERGESESVVVTVANHEYEPTSYSVVLQLQRIEETAVGNQTTLIVQDRETLDVVETGELAHDQTWHRESDIEPTMTGDQLRLAFLLYQDTPPDEPTSENAYEEVYLWVNVEES